jgi:hypothetical protein
MQPLCTGDNQLLQQLSPEQPTINSPRWGSKDLISLPLPGNIPQTFDRWLQDLQVEPEYLTV